MEPQLRSVLTETIMPSPFQPKARAESDVDGLAQSIKSNGLLQPITVRTRSEPGLFEIVIGSRRLKAIAQLGWKEIPVIVREMGDDEARELIVVENLQREDLSPMEEAAGILELLSSGKTLQEVADKLGRGGTWVAKRAKLLNLSPKWQDAIKEPDEDNGLVLHLWTPPMLELVARYDHAAQDSLLEDYDLLENVNSLPALKRYLAEREHMLSAAKWSPADEALVPDAGSCGKCQKRSGCQPDLFSDDDDVDTRDRCLDPTCWRRKEIAYIERQAETLRLEYANLKVVHGHGGRGGLDYSHPLYKTAEYDYGFGKARKDDPDAVPALVIDGDAAGSVQWVKANDAERPSSMTFHQRNTEGTLTLEARRQRHEKRRIVETTKTLIEILEAEKERADYIARMPTERILAAGIILGISGPPEPLSFVRLETEPVLWEIMGIEDADIPALVEGVAVGVVTNLINALRKNEMASSPSDVVNANVCDLIGYDYEALRAHIEEKLPEPRSWSNLNPDGTKRTVAAGGKDA